MAGGGFGAECDYGEEDDDGEDDDGEDDEEEEKEEEEEEEEGEFRGTTSRKRGRCGWTLASPRRRPKTRARTQATRRLAALAATANRVSSLQALAATERGDASLQSPRHGRPSRGAAPPARPGALGSLAALGQSGAASRPWPASRPDEEAQFRRRAEMLRLPTPAADAAFDQRRAALGLAARSVPRHVLDTLLVGRERRRRREQARRAADIAAPYLKQAVAEGSRSSAASLLAFARSSEAAAARTERLAAQAAEATSAAAQRSTASSGSIIPARAAAPVPASAPSPRPAPESAPAAAPPGGLASAATAARTAKPSAALPQQAGSALLLALSALGSAASVFRRACLSIARRVAAGDSAAVTDAPVCPGTDQPAASALRQRAQALEAALLAGSGSGALVAASAARLQGGALWEATLSVLELPSGAAHAASGRAARGHALLPPTAGDALLKACLAACATLRRRQQQPGPGRWSATRPAIAGAALPSLGAPAAAVELARLSRGVARGRVPQAWSGPRPPPPSTVSLCRELCQALIALGVDPTLLKPPRAAAAAARHTPRALQDARTTATPATLREAPAREAEPAGPPARPPSPPAAPPLTPPPVLEDLSASVSGASASAASAHRRLPHHEPPPPPSASRVSTRPAGKQAWEAIKAVLRPLFREGTLSKDVYASACKSVHSALREASKTGPPSSASPSATDSVLLSDALGDAVLAALGRRVRAEGLPDHVPLPRHVARVAAGELRRCLTHAQ